MMVTLRHTSRLAKCQVELMDGSIARIHPGVLDIIVLITNRAGNTSENDEIMK